MVIAVLACLVVVMAVRSTRAGAIGAQEIPKESKDQPKKVKLDQDSVDDKWGEVAFDHETHSTRNYNAAGSGAVSCVECHHTDQPKESLKAPYVTSERKVTLTPAVLNDPAAGPVKSCRSCHLQAGDDSKPIPTITKDGKQLKLDNEAAYHTNCFVCHDAAIKAKPELAAKIAGSDPKGCNKCHVAK
jgi:hypothetical protein